MLVSFTRISLLLSLALGLNAASAESLNVSSSADGYIRASQSAAETRNETNSMYLVGHTAKSGDELRSVLVFDIDDSRLEGATILDAKLVLEVNGRDMSGGGSADRTQTLEVYEIAPFAEGQVDWNNRLQGTPWTSAGGDFEQPLAQGQANAATVERGSRVVLQGKGLAAAVQEHLGDSLYLLVKQQQEDGARSIFRLKSGAARLILTYEPAPGAAAEMSALRQAPAGQPETPMPSVHPVPGNLEDNASPRYAMVAGGHPIEVKAERFEFDVAMLTMGDEPVMIDVMVLSDFDDYSLAPKRHGIEVERIGNALRFTLDHPHDLVLQIPGRTPLAIIVTPNETEIPDANDPDVVFYEPGVTNAGVIRPESGQTLYFAPGALVKGRIEARGVDNVRIMGRGILDASDYAQRDLGNPCILFDRSSNILVEGIGLRSYHTWWQTLYLNSQDIEVAHMNIFGLGVNTDGVDIDAVKNFLVRDTFIRAEDDGLGWHSLDAAENGEMITENAHAQDLVIWNTRWGNGIRIGASMEAQLWRDITIRDVDILMHDGAGIYSDYSDWAWMQDLSFINVTIAKTENPINFYIAKTRYSNKTGYSNEMGNVDRLLFQNVAMSGGTVRLSGYDKEHLISTVRFNDCTTNGKPLDRLSQIEVNEFVTDVKFNEPLPPLPKAESGVFEAAACESRVKGAAQHIARADGATQGRLRIFRAKATGDYIEHDLDVVEAGTYTLSMTYRTSPDAGQVSVAANDETLTENLDFYASEPTFETVELGTVNVDEPGLLSVRVTVDGKASASDGYGVELDSFTLTKN